MRQSQCQSVLQELVMSQPGETQAMWSHLVASLLSSNDLAPVFDRKNKAIFQRNLQQLVIDSRCICN